MYDLGFNFTGHWTTVKDTNKREYVAILYYLKHLDNIMLAICKHKKSQGGNYFLTLGYEPNYGTSMARSTQQFPHLNLAERFVEEMFAPYGPKVIVNNECLEELEGLYSSHISIVEHIPGAYGHWDYVTLGVDTRELDDDRQRYSYFSTHTRVHLPAGEDMEFNVPNIERIGARFNERVARFYEEMDGEIPEGTSVYDYRPEHRDGIRPTARNHRN